MLAFSFGCFVELWTEFSKRCFWVFRLIGGFFINLCETWEIVNHLLSLQ